MKNRTRGDRAAIRLALAFAVTSAGTAPADAVSRTASGCTGTVYELAKPFVGTWQEFTVKGEDEPLAGTLSSSFGVDGCVFTQRFASPDGGFSFMSFAYVEPKTQQWRETFVLNSGRVAHYRWRGEGDDVVFDRLGSDPPFRLRVMNLKRDSYDVVEERSADGGETWSRGERTRRVK